MPSVSGSLIYVTLRAAAVSEVLVRAPEVRTGAGGVITSSADRVPVTGGSVSFTVSPGPAVLTLVEAGRAVETIPILVGSGASQSLQQVVSAAKVADDATKREIEKLAAQAVELIDASVENARKAQDGATRAEAAAGNAQRSEASSASSASTAASSASKADTSERNAKKSADNSYLYSMGARSSADRAANIADSTSWNGDRLTVNGKTSPPLKGDKGDKGEPGSTAPHTHTSSQITDAVWDLWKTENGGKLLKLRSDGGIFSYADDRADGRAIMPKRWIESKINAKAEASHTHTTAQVTGLDAALSGKAAQADMVALQQKLAALTAPVTVFQGSHTMSNGTLQVQTPRMYGTVTITVDQSGPDNQAGLVQPRIFNYLGTRYKGGIDGWWTTTGGAGTAYKYLTDVGNGQTITLDPGYYIDGIEIYSWQTGANVVKKITVQN